jgi:predicted O-methyltransferase YrrM
MILNSGTFFRLFGDGRPTSPATDTNFAMPFDRRILLALARTIRPEVVVEFGVQSGITAALLLGECPWIRRYVGIDLPAGQKPVQASQAAEVPGTPGELAAADPRFELLLADSATIETGRLPVACMVWIDGGHDYEHVLADTRLARAIVRPGGAIAWHDYTDRQPDVRRVVDEANRAEGDHIALVDGSWTCFELRREGPAAPLAFPAEIPPAPATVRRPAATRRTRR